MSGKALEEYQQLVEEKNVLSASEGFRSSVLNPWKNE